jgi:hypothetical protein
LTKLILTYIIFLGIKFLKQVNKEVRYDSAHACSISVSLWALPSVLDPKVLSYERSSGNQDHDETRSARILHDHDFWLDNRRQVLKEASKMLMIVALSVVWLFVSFVGHVMVNTGRELYIMGVIMEALGRLCCFLQIGVIFLHAVSAPGSFALTGVFFWLIMAVISPHLWNLVYKVKTSGAS